MEEEVECGIRGVLMLQDPYTKKYKKTTKIKPKGVQLLKISVQVKRTKVLDYKVRVDAVHMSNTSPIPRLRWNESITHGNA